MHQFLFNLNSCTSETLLKVGSSLPEMVAQEKVVDGVVELLKANQLDENSSTDSKGQGRCHRPRPKPDPSHRLIAYISQTSRRRCPSSTRCSLC